MRHARDRRRKAPKESDIIPSDRLLMLIGFIGQELLMHTKKRANLSMEREIIEVTGMVLGGRFKLRVTFDGEVEH